MPCRLTLPGSIEALYEVYNDLDTAEARILLPKKVREFPQLDRDAAVASDTSEPQLLPECVGATAVCPSGSRIDLEIPIIRE